VPQALADSFVAENLAKVAGDEKAETQAPANKAKVAKNKADEAPSSKALNPNPKSLRKPISALYPRFNSKVYTLGPGLPWSLWT
jgi:hypothetical protein